MKFLTFRHDHGLRLGALREGRVCDLETAAADAEVSIPASFPALMRAGAAALPRIDWLLDALPDDAACWHDPGELELGPAVPETKKILCVGLNYRAHAKEAGMEIPKVPILFSKFPNALAASGADVDVSGLVQVDYEAELAVVIGATCRRITVEEALARVFGYCCANDLSEREMQMRTSQWLIGKTHDGFLPIGPYLVTADEIEDPQKLSIRGWLNGELRQDSTTADMVFGVADIVSYASHYMTLDPGDVIVTGTPEGVILGREQKDWMRPGDEYVVEIEGLGRLVTRLSG